MPRPDLASVPEWYHKYLMNVPETDLMQAFANHSSSLIQALERIPEGQWGYRYERDKWSVKEMVQHIIDAERIFCYRALCFARKEIVSLPGFDEVAYAQTSKADNRTPASLLEELKVVQKSSFQLFASLDDEQLGTSGIANGSVVSVNAIGFILIGHGLHHLSILRERYLPGIDAGTASD